MTKAYHTVAIALLCISTLTPTALYAENSSWIGGASFGNWDNSANWDNGVPNNGGTTYSAFIGPTPAGATLITSSSVTIDSLSISGNSYLGVVNRDLVVLGNTDFGSQLHVTISSESMFAPTSVDLGTVNSGVFSGNTLNNVSIEASGLTAIKWAGANIHIIGSDGSVYLSGSDSSIRNSSDDSDALAGFSQNDGGFSIRNRTFTTGDSFTNNGTFVTESGLLAVSGEGDLALGADSNFDIWFANNMDAVGSILAEGDAVIDGDLHLKYSSFSGIPEFITTGTFEILTAQSVSGNFGNIMDGQRIYLEDEFGDPSGGSFLFTIEADRILLSDFQPIPEPSTYLLLAIGIGGIAFARWKRKSALFRAR